MNEPRKRGGTAELYRYITLQGEQIATGTSAARFFRAFTQFLGAVCGTQYFLLHWGAILNVYFVSLCPTLGSVHGYIVASLLQLPMAFLAAHQDAYGSLQPHRHVLGSSWTFSRDILDTAVKAEDSIADRGGVIVRAHAADDSIEG